MTATTALLVSAGISAGVGLINAKKGSDAAKAATAAQSASTDKSLDVAKQMYDTSQANLKPYMDAGSSSAGLLGKLMIPGQSWTGAPSNMAAPAPGGYQGLGAQARQPMTQAPAPMQTAPIGMRLPGRNLGREMMSPGSGMGEATITMISPDGASTAQVPMSKVQAAIAAGARPAGQGAMN